MTLDEIVKKAIPDDPKDCRIKKAQKEALRLSIKRDIALLIAKNFVPKDNVAASHGIPMPPTPPPDRHIREGEIPKKPKY